MALRIKNNLASVNTLRHLSNNQNALSQSLERLASGQKINKGSDDPAGLVISENLRAQIAGIDQAIQNSEISVSIVQTAEGALTEVNNLLIQSRQLALAAANEGANDTNAIIALQGQLDNALESIDRVSTNTRFGDKALLDGSRGISGASNSDELVFLRATEATRSSPVRGFDVDVLEAPSRASITSDFSDSQAEELVLTLTEGGKTITVVGEEDETAASFVGKVAEAIQSSQLDIELDFSEASETLTFDHKRFGSEAVFQVGSSKSNVFVEEGGTVQEINNGSDIVGTINGESATGVGRVLVGNAGNEFTDGLAILYKGTEVGSPGTVSVSQNSLAFQIGPNEGQQVRISIDDTSTVSLARGINNESGFQNLSDVDVTTAQGAEDSIRLLNSAIAEVSGVRGRLGAFQKNALETNTATLRVTAENLIAAESSIRDTDIAFELAEFTKNQILTQAAAAANAQSNNLSTNSLASLFGDS